MNLKNELKSIVAKRGTNFKKICEIISEKTNNPKFNNNNLSSRIYRQTIKFKEVEMILKELGYKIEFVELKPIDKSSDFA